MLPCILLDHHTIKLEHDNKMSYKNDKIQRLINAYLMITDLLEKSAKK